MNVSNSRENIINDTDEQKNIVERGLNGRKKLSGFFVANAYNRPLLVGLTMEGMVSSHPNYFLATAIEFHKKLKVKKSILIGRGV